MIMFGAGVDSYICLIRKAFHHLLHHFYRLFLFSVQSTEGLLCLKCTNCQNTWQQKGQARVQGHRTGSLEQQCAGHKECQWQRCTKEESIGRASEAAAHSEKVDVVAGKFPQCTCHPSGNVQP